MFAKNAAKIIAALVLVLLILLIAFLFIVHQPRLLANTSLYLLKKTSKNVVFKEIIIDQVHWSSWGDVVLQNVRIKCKIKDVSYFFSTGEVDIAHLTAFLFATPMNIEIKNLAVVSDRLNVSDISLKGQIDFKKFRYEGFSGSLVASQLEWDRYVFEKIRANCKGKNLRFSFSDLQAQAYGGTVDAKGWLNYSNGLSYRINLQLSNIDSSRIAQVNPHFEQVTAVINGAVVIKDYKKKGFLVESDLNAPLGGSMKASLLKFLAKYVPQRQQVEDLIEQNADVSLTKLQAKITSIDKEKIVSEVILNSSSLNLNMDVKFDIYVEGGIKALLEYVRQ